MSHDEAQQIVHGATRCDAAALETLLVRHLSALTGYIRLHADPVVRQHESCWDVAQSVCCDALQAVDGFEFRGEPAFRKWLFTLALRKLVNHKRHYLARKRDVGREERFVSVDGRTGLEALHASMSSPSQGAIAREAAERFERAFDRLPEDYRTVITMARIFCMPCKDIAAEMGRPEGAVRVLLHRALVRLGRLMDEGAWLARSDG